MSSLSLSLLLCKDVSSPGGLSQASDELIYERRLEQGWAVASVPQMFAQYSLSPRKHFSYALYNGIKLYTLACHFPCYLAVCHDQPFG